MYGGAAESTVPHVPESLRDDSVVEPGSAYD